MFQPADLAEACRRAESARATGDVHGARSALTAALDAARPELGDDHPAVVSAAHQLAGVLRAADDPAGARRVLEDALAGAHWQLGDADPLILAISFDLGSVAAELGNRHEARRAFGRVATHGPAVLGNDHWKVRQARAYLGVEEPVAWFTPPDPRRSPAGGTSDGWAMPPAQPARPDQQPGQVSTPVPPPLPPSAVTPAPPAQFGRPTPGAPARGLTPETPPGPAPEPPRRPTPEPPRGPTPMAARPAQTWQPVWSPGEIVPTAAAAPVRSAPVRPTPARRSLILLAAAVTVAVVMTAVALYVVLARWGPAPGERGAAPGPLPTVADPAPTDVRLTESGGAITVTWTDPSAGTVSFIVTGGRADEQLAAMGRLDPGSTRYELHGLNPRIDYCFTVVAVYGVDRLASSPRTCTSRAGVRPRESVHR